MSQVSWYSAKFSPLIFSLSSGAFSVLFRLLNSPLTLHLFNKRALCLHASLMLCEALPCDNMFGAPALSFDDVLLLLQLIVITD